MTWRVLIVFWLSCLAVFGQQSLLISGNATIPLAPNYDQWTKRIVAAGGSPTSSNTLWAVTQFTNGLSSDGLLTKMYSVLVFVPDSVIAACTPVVATKGLDSWTIIGGTNWDLTVNGLKPGATNSYIKSGFNPSTDFNSITDFGVSAYETAFSSSSTCPAIGCSDAAGGGDNLVKLFCVWSGTTHFFFGCITANFVNVAASATRKYGFVCGVRDAASGGLKMYHRNPENAITTVATVNGGGTLPNQQIWCFQDNLAGNPDTVAFNRRLSYAAIHTKLTQAEADTLYGRIITLRDALGGGTGP